MGDPSWGDLALEDDDWEEASTEMIGVTAESLFHVAPVNPVALAVPEPDMPVEEHPNMSSKLQVSEALITRLAQPHQGTWAQDLLNAPLQAATAQSRLSSTRMAGDIERLAHFYLQDHPPMHLSKAAVGQITNVPLDNIETALGTLVNSLVHMERAQRAQLEQAVVQSGCRLVLFGEGCRYDETPMKLTQKQALTFFCWLTQAQQLPESKVQHPLSKETTSGSNMSRRLLTARCSSLKRPLS